jgi:hypothetical protein
MQARGDADLSMPDMAKAAAQLSLTCCAAKARDLKSIRDSGTALRMRDHSRTTCALTLATLLKLPKLT